MPAPSLAWDVEAARREWEAGRFRPAYFFPGEDGAAKDAALGALKKALRVDDLNISEFSGDAQARAAEIVSVCQTAPMFSDRRLVIVRGLKLGAEGRRALAEYLDSPAPATTLVLLQEEKASPKKGERDVLLDAVARRGLVVAFGELDPEDAAARLREAAKAAGFELPQEAADAIVEEAGSCWGVLQGELEKIRLFLKGRKEARLEDALSCLGARRETGPYELSNAVERRDLEASLDALRRMLEEGASGYELLPKISHAVNSQLKAKRMLKAGTSQYEMWGKIRVFGSPRQAAFLRAVSALSDARLVNDLKACLKTEADLKSKTWLEPAIELERLLVRLCWKQASRPA